MLKSGVNRGIHEVFISVRGCIALSARAPPVLALNPDAARNINALCLKNHDTAFNYTDLVESLCVELRLDLSYRICYRCVMSYVPVNRLSRYPTPTARKRKHARARLREILLQLPVDAYVLVHPVDIGWVREISRLIRRDTGRLYLFAEGGVGGRLIVTRVE